MAGGRILSLGDLSPRLGRGVFVAEGAVVVGDVQVGDNSSVWYGCVLRGDVNRIVVGSGTNIQDGTVIHVESDDAARYRGKPAGLTEAEKAPVFGEGLPTVIGDNVTVGHKALLHACRVGDGALVGMGSVVMDGAVVESGSLLAAGSLLSPGKCVPSGEVWAGRPARRMRSLREREVGMLLESAERYVELAARYLSSGL
ncbi:MAG: gamma carbonic anhydrase family protein [Alphaproteobacteria bacterium]|nr:gamma carbonic anhydrase family protein [Alphaproteobacteria bacterium]MDA8004258.1 gamma carbonic anhydrase family protein [Alphaproteobacteria bacterium]MDA8005378.1 gamma carbonic anhydrase family protein [Alphaproteobacteria bacterium]MDA8013411.1 gamma carbonic anhydrase family protein [Alphaproteobacteria bacterium]